MDDMRVDSGFHDYLLRDVLKEHHSDELEGAEAEVRRGQGCTLASSPCALRGEREREKGGGGWERIGGRTMMLSMTMRMGCVLKLGRFVNVQYAPIGPLGHHCM